MGYNLFTSLFAKSGSEPLLAIDIGSSSIKVMELDVIGDKPRLITMGSAPTPAGAVNNNMVVRPDLVATQIRSIISSNDMTSKKAVVAVPGPSAFTKKISTGVTSLKEFKNNIIFEASNYIPHKIENVFLDYQILRTNGRSSMEVLLVAVKNEIVQSFVDAVEQAGLEPTIVDIDYFALENMFDLNYPEERNRTLALVNIGARFTSVNIVQDGNSLFTGDVSVGARMYNDALCDQLGCDVVDAENAKCGRIPESMNHEAVRDTMQQIIEKTTDHITTELQRQIGFFWNAAATDRTIEEIYLCGGGVQVPGFVSALQEKLGVSTKVIETLRNIECSDGIDADYLAELAPSMGVGVGLALRRLGDKQHAIG